MLAVASAAMTLNARDSKYTRRGAGPLYWMAYEQCYVTNVALAEDRYQKSVDWVAENFLRYGYNMVCTDGWIEGAQTVNSNGYILKYNSDWKHGFDYWIDYNRKKGLDTGIYYNPLWLTRKAFSDNMKISGSSQRTRDIVGNKSFNDLLYWVDVNKQGAEQWIKGYVRYFINLGFTFLRVDFLRDYEDYYGTDSYVKALKWIKEEAGDEIMISLVMPNCFNHAVNELPYGDSAPTCLREVGTSSATADAVTTMPTGLSGKTPSMVSCISAMWQHADRLSWMATSFASTHATPLKRGNSGCRLWLLQALLLLLPTSMTR